MKRFTVVAALAATALVPAAQSAAIPPDTAGGPLGWGGACMVVGGTPAKGECRFTASGDTVGAGGFAGPGAVITLSHKETVVTCAAGNVTGYETVTVVDEKVTGPNYLGVQDSLSDGVVYTLSITGPGFAVAGGPSEPAAAPPAEPADKPADRTGGKQVGAAC